MTSPAAFFNDEELAVMKLRYSLRHPDSKWLSPPLGPEGHQPPGCSDRELHQTKMGASMAFRGGGSYQCADPPKWPRRLSFHVVASRRGISCFGTAHSCRVPRPERPCRGW